MLLSGSLVKIVPDFHFSDFRDAERYLANALHYSYYQMKTNICVELCQDAKYSDGTKECQRKEITICLTVDDGWIDKKVVLCGYDFKLLN